MRKKIFIIIAAALCLCGCGGSEGNGGAENDSNAVDMTLDTLLTKRLEDLVARKVRMTDEQLSICVYDLTCGEPLYSFRSGVPVAPASCLKMLTAIAALKYMGLDYRYRDSLYIKGEVQSGTLYGSVIVRTDDDPLFESFDGFAQALRDTGISRIEGDIVYDIARSDTLKAHATAKSWDIPYHKVPLLLKGRQRIEQEWRQQLAAKGIRFRPNEMFAGHRIADNDPDTTPLLHRLAIDMARNGATPLAGETHALTEVITPMLLHSSNIKADALYWHLRNVYGRLFEEDVLHAFLKYELGIPYATSRLVINDGSGLSPENRLTTDFLVQLMRYAYKEKAIFRYLIDEALPTPAGGERQGTLMGRMASGPCVGRIFCKTGTLVTIGGSGLTGYALGKNNHWYAFSILNIDMPVADAREFQDKFCRELVE